MRSKRSAALGGLPSNGSARSRRSIPFDHLIGTAIGWGGNPRNAAVYQSVYPKKNDGKTVLPSDGQGRAGGRLLVDQRLQRQGLLREERLNAYSLNNLTAKPNADGSVTIQFGGCGTATPNCLPIMPGWNYTVRLYRPRKEILDGTWKFPEAQPLS